jgi:CheY-like chemotaxis protein
MGLPLRSAMRVERFLALYEEERPRLVLLDLTTPGLDPRALFDRLSEPRPKVIAFGPHVHEDRLQAARDAGCNLVLPRGQFFVQLERFLTSCD